MDYVILPGTKKLSGCIKPMLASSAREPFNDPEYIFELKYDGFRAIAEVGQEVRLYSRHGTSFLKAYPRIVSELKKIKQPMILDGEVVVVGKDGKPDFNGLQNYSSRSSTTLLYYVFDCLSINGKGITKKPLIERKLALRDRFDCSGIIRYCDHVQHDGLALFSMASEMGLEGIVAKKIHSFYSEGIRSKDWIKIKNYQLKDFWIIGYGTKEFSLILGEVHQGKLLYRGEVGTGWNMKTRSTIFALLNASTTDGSIVFDSARIRDVQWVYPQYICSVKFLDLTEDGLVRHSIFLGLV